MPTADELRAELRQVAAQIREAREQAKELDKELSTRRDSTIRDAYAAGVKVVDLAKDGDVSVPRVHQIRHRRR
jgi:hypothetical protein